MTPDSWGPAGRGWGRGGELGMGCLYHRPGPAVPLLAGQFSPNEPPPPPGVPGLPVGRGATVAAQLRGDRQAAWPQCQPGRRPSELVAVGPRHWGRRGSAGNLHHVCWRTAVSAPRRVWMGPRCCLYKRPDGGRSGPPGEPRSHRPDHVMVQPLEVILSFRAVVCSPHPLLWQNAADTRARM